MPARPLRSSTSAVCSGRPMVRLLPAPTSSSGALRSSADITASTSAAGVVGCIRFMGSEPRQVGETQRPVMNMDPAQFRAAAKLREDLAGIEQLLRVEGAFEPHLVVEIGLGEHGRHQVALLDPDAMLA